MNKSANIFFLFMIAFSGIFACQKQVTTRPESLLVSHISDQWTFEGTRLTFFLHAIHQDLTDVTFSLENNPGFVHLNAQNGKAEITVDAPTDSEGQYTFKVVIEKGQRKTIKHVQLTIKKAPETVYYLDKKSGKDENDGSFQNPWSSPQPLKKLPNVSTPVLILLKKGTFGHLLFEDDFGRKIYLMPLTGEDVNVGKVIFSTTQNIILKGLNINGNTLEKESPFIFIDSLSRNIEIANCKIGNQQIAKKWNLNDWKNNSRNGIFSYGDSISITHNLISCTNHSLDTRGLFNEVNYNIVDRFGGDAIRNTGSNSTFAFNTMKNAIVADYDEPCGNHDDLFQSWTFDKPIENIILKNNIAVAYSEEDLKFPSKIVQGLVCFDGFAENWQIENNLVLVDHPHGITLLGAKNCTIINNTVSRNPLKFQEFDSAPWIMVDKHKDGRSGNSNIVRNNIIPILMTGEAEALEGYNTLTDTNYTSVFQSFYDWDFNLKPTSAAVDAGSSELAPEYDLQGHERPTGNAWDTGCFEFEL